MYRQLYLALYDKEPGNSFDESDALLHAIIYLDFTGVFDRHPVGWVKELQRRAEWMFRPEGIQIDFGKETFRFVAFERSASMSRENKLSFVRADLYDVMWERMTLGIKDNDSLQMRRMMQDAAGNPDYETVLIRNCVNVMRPVDAQEAANRIPWEDAVKCAELLGKRQFILEVLPAVALDLAVDRSEPQQMEKKKGWWKFWSTK